jgi:hypothetical protein
VLSDEVDCLDYRCIEVVDGGGNRR